MSTRSLKAEILRMKSIQAIRQGLPITCYERPGVINMSTSSSQEGNAISTLKPTSYFVNIIFTFFLCRHWRPLSIPFDLIGLFMFWHQHKWPFWVSTLHCSTYISRPLTTQSNETEQEIIRKNPKKSFTTIKLFLVLYS